MGLNGSDFLALGAAVSWSVTSVLAVEPARHLGAFAFTRWRMVMVALMLWIWVLLGSGWSGFNAAQTWPLMLSGLVGIFIGDTALFAAMNRLGPRRCSVLFATHAAFSVLLGVWWLGERLNGQAWLGAVLTVAGVMTAVALGKHKDEGHEWERNRGHLGLGVALALVAALCQALGGLIAKPVMAQGVDPLAASAVRVSVAALAHVLLLSTGFAGAKAHQAPTRRVIAQTALNGFIGMGIGMSLILLALRTGDASMVGVFSSVTPVLVLPLLWWRLGRAPAPGAWLGAGLTVVGTATLMLR